MSPSPSISAGNVSMTSIAFEVTIFCGPKSALTRFMENPSNANIIVDDLAKKPIENPLRIAGVFFIAIDFE